MAFQQNSLIVTFANKTNTITFAVLKK